MDKKHLKSGEYYYLDLTDTPSRRNREVVQRVVQDAVRDIIEQNTPSDAARMIALLALDLYDAGVKWGRAHED